MVLFPETRFEAFLAKIAGQEGPDLEPITRTEAFLDDIADGENNLEPRTRIEYWLQKIAENAGGGGASVNDILSAYFNRESVAPGKVTFTGTTLYVTPAYSPIVEFDAPEMTADSTQATSATNGHFAHCDKLVRVSMPKLQTLYNKNAYFSDCPKLTSVDLSALTSAYSSNMFKNCTSLKRVVLPRLSGTQSIMPTDFAPNSGIEYLDIGSAIRLAGNALRNMTQLTQLVLHRADVVTLDNVNAFTGTPFASDGTGGVLYVPSAQIAGYQADTNWSTILSYTNNDIAAIEDM